MKSYFRAVAVFPQNFFDDSTPDRRKFPLLANP